METCNKYRMIVLPGRSVIEGAQWWQPQEVGSGDTSWQDNGWGCRSVGTFQGRIQSPWMTFHLQLCLPSHPPCPHHSDCLSNHRILSSFTHRAFGIPISALMSSPHRGFLRTLCSTWVHFNYLHHLRTFTLIIYILSTRTQAQRKQGFCSSCSLFCTIIPATFTGTSIPVKAYWVLIKYWNEWLHQQMN